MPKHLKSAIYAGNPGFRVQDVVFGYIVRKKLQTAGFSTFFSGFSSKKGSLQGAESIFCSIRLAPRRSPVGRFSEKGPKVSGAP